MISEQESEEQKKVEDKTVNDIAESTNTDKNYAKEHIIVKVFSL